MHRIEYPASTASVSQKMVGLGRLLRGEDGKISIVAVPWVMGIIVLIGLVGNSGQAINEKIEVQTAADTSAYSTALWQARGMNALTTTNHLMGEFAALAVIHESLGGPELDKGQELKTDENTQKTDYLRDNKDDAPQNGPEDANPLKSENTFGSYRRIDKPICDNILDHIIDTKMISGATIYDGRMTLKSCACVLVWIKVEANNVAQVGTALRNVPLPVISQIGLLIEAVTCGIQVAATLELIVVGKEWLVIDVHEQGAQGTSFIKTLLRETVIPALSKYGDLVAGQNSAGAIGISPVNLAVSHALREFKTIGRMDELAVFPEPGPSTGNVLRLPVIVEPGLAGSSSSRPQSQWTGEDPRSGALLPILELQGRVNDLFGKLKPIVKFVSAFAEFSGQSDELEGVPNLVQDVRNFLPLYHRQNWPQNPSWTESLPEFDWQTERTSQFNRATYPYVDAFRRPVRGGWLESEPWSFLGIPTSRAAQYYANWTNRYTVTEVNRLREAGSHMYVVNDFDPQLKGREPWVTQDRRAEVYFSVFGVARRSRRPPTLFPSLFRDANTVDVVAMSQAMFYNANGIQLNGDGQHQPNTGWDTLNWEPTVQAPEWVDHNPGREGGRLVFQILAGQSRVSPRSTRVKLNWQAKLIPITATRLGDALNGNVGTEIQKPLKAVQEHFSTVTH